MLSLLSRLIETGSYYDLQGTGYCCNDREVLVLRSSFSFDGDKADKAPVNVMLTVIAAKLLCKARINAF